MTAHDLLDRLTGLGVVLLADGVRLRYSPRSVVTADLLDQLRRHKAELLDVLTMSKCADAAEVQPRVVGRVDDTDLPKTPPPGPDGWPDGCIDPATLTPCATCGRLELWQSLAGNWRCLHCDPPVVADRLRDRAAQLKNRYTSGPRTRD